MTQKTHINNSSNINLKTDKMKTLLFTFAIFAFTMVNAQEFETAKSTGFDVESGTDTKTTMTIDGEAYNLFETATGSLYIKCTSAKTGNLYPVWIGEPANVRHEGKAVYKMKSGKYCIYKIGKSGNPYPVWLKQKI